MKITIRYRLLILFVSVFGLVRFQAQAQVAENVDSLFLEARQLAFSAQYAESRMICREILLLAPQYQDARLLKSRTYAWEGLYDSARSELLPLLEYNPPPADAFQVIASVELWAKAPQKSLHYAMQGLQQYPDRTALMLSKAKALEMLNRSEEAIAVLEMILQFEQNNQQATNLLASLKRTNADQYLQTNYQLTDFYGQTTRHTMGLEYGRMIKSSEVIARLTMAQQQQRKDIQAEIEAYPKFGKNTYAYLLAGLSYGSIFPSQRLSGELFRILPYRFEVSGGVRTMRFPEENIVLYTGSVGKYLKNYWLGFRPFFQSKNAGWQTTGLWQVRRYFADQQHHLTLLLAKGGIPAVQQGIREVYGVNTHAVGLQGQFYKKQWSVKAQLFYEIQEQAGENYRRLLTAGINVRRIF